MPPVYRPQPIPVDAMHAKAQAGVVRWDLAVNNAVNSFIKFEELKIKRAELEAAKEQAALDTMIKQHELEILKAKTSPKMMDAQLRRYEAETESFIAQAQAEKDAVDREKEKLEARRKLNAAYNILKTETDPQEFTRVRDEIMTGEVPAILGDEVRVIDNLVARRDQSAVPGDITGKTFGELRHEKGFNPGYISPATQQKTKDRIAIQASGITDPAEIQRRMAQIERHRELVQKEVGEQAEARLESLNYEYNQRARQYKNFPKDPVSSVMTVAAKERDPSKSGKYGTWASLAETPDGFWRRWQIARGLGEPVGSSNFIKLELNELEKILLVERESGGTEQEIAEIDNVLQTLSQVVPMLDAIDDEFFDSDVAKTNPQLYGQLKSFHEDLSKAIVEKSKEKKNILLEDARRQARSIIYSMIKGRTRVQNALEQYARKQRMALAPTTMTTDPLSAYPGEWKVDIAPMGTSDTPERMVNIDVNTGDIIP